MATVPLPHQFAVGEVVTADNINTLYSGITFLENRPLFKGTTTVNVSIPNNAFTTLALNNNVVDTYNGHSVVTNNTRYTAQVAGWYLIGGAASWANNVTGERGALLAVNGSAIAETFQQTLSPGSLTAGMGVASGPLFFNVNDYVEMQVYQNSGGALNVTNAFLSALWIHV